MHDNRFNDYRIPSGMLIVFLEKALTLIHMETHLDDVSTFAPANSKKIARVLSHNSNNLTLERRNQRVQTALLTPYSSYLRCHC